MPLKSINQSFLCGLTHKNELYEDHGGFIHLLGVYKESDKGGRVIMS